MTEFHPSADSTVEDLWPEGPRCRPEERWEKGPSSPPTSEYTQGRTDSRPRTGQGGRGGRRRDGRRRPTIPTPTSPVSVDVLTIKRPTKN